MFMPPGESGAFPLSARPAAFPVASLRLMARPPASYNGHVQPLPGDASAGAAVLPACERPWASCEIFARPRPDSTAAGPGTDSS